MNAKQKILLIVLFSVGILCLVIGCDFKTKIPQYSPCEYIKTRYEYDSIQITEKNNGYAKNWLEANLKKQVTYYEIGLSSYNDSLKVFVFDYHFHPKNSESRYDKTVYIKMNFDSNNGNYIVKPKIVKLIGYLHICPNCGKIHKNE